MGQRVCGEETSPGIINLCVWVGESGFTTGIPSEEAQFGVRERKTDEDRE